MEIVMRISFRNGQECVHRPSFKDDDELDAIIGQLQDVLDGPQNGTFMVWRPLGIHRLSDIEAVHMEDVELPPRAAVRSIGFNLSTPA